MINRIVIKSKASYDDTGVVIDQLKQVNFVYGTNGSGKTTISNLLKNPEKYPQSEISWVNSSELRKLVYNKDFIEENFHQDSNIKGIFTLGKESHDIQQAIESRRIELNKTNDELSKLEIIRQQKTDEQIQNESVFEEQCWKLKQKYDSVFEEAFKGFRAVKTKFKEKCKEEARNTEIIETYDELQNRCSRVFGSTKEKVGILRKIDPRDCLEITIDPIFSSKIIGREDIDISRLISKLNISDWVKQGHDHLKLTNGVCPFCQQTTGEEFGRKLDELFNEEFNKQIDYLNEVCSKYSRTLVDVIEQVDVLLEIENEYINKQEISSRKEIIKTKYQANMLLLSKKKNEPSSSIVLESCFEDIIAINKMIDAYNREIRNHNELIDNIIEEKRILIARVWKFISVENKDNLKLYEEKDFSLNSAKTGILSKIETKKETKKMLIKEIEEFESQITSVIPSINEMNNLLKSFSFTNFKFSETSIKGNYSIVRENGEDAKETLSEGEKTFVTFLYFVQLLNGSNDKSRITENKIVVIDDPISSLDSNIIFIVSSLIRKIIDEIRKNRNGMIRQLFILTHNIYFHKEVSFNKGKGTNRLSDESFWILRKINNVSQIKYYESNPIKSSYELMWQEVKFAQERSSSSVQNLIRRIIENYFKIFGNYHEDQIIDLFNDEEKVICKSLMSWVNDGSHFINDDLYSEVTIDMVEKYLKVFEKIFEVTGHHAHYRMMMGMSEDYLPLSS
ncbi:AAA family ATPase [Paenibacillus luteus]|uniref:AAA family ATPase n=1 Tax=Paenibacillus luteus TaxID=2545753 RepID=UPI0011450F3B|nr:AAA family ATPase [Paenibacillus luteus]